MITDDHSRLPCALRVALKAWLTDEHPRFSLLLALLLTIPLCHCVVEARGLNQVATWGVLCSGGMNSSQVVTKSDAT